MKKITLNVKPFQETLYASRCGPASLKIVLGYYGINLSEKKLVRLTRTTRKIGTDDKGIASVAQFLGFKVGIKDKSTFDDIEKWLKRGIPVIVNWFTRGRADYSNSEVADGHYSVVVGLDDKHIYLQDPEIGELRKIKKDDFMKVWFDFMGEYLKPNELIIRQLIAIYK